MTVSAPKVRNLGFEAELYLLTKISKMLSPSFVADLELTYKSVNIVLLSVIESFLFFTVSGDWLFSRSCC